ncbi:uncharacterized protein LOC126830160 [Patella vulgata]|uniref:uncharacterized protein LOC126830160 n=1 Tax=Patella vulgata TaxID=6465 RepID=UPI00217F7757|nr:uncharacterized protein LOC126830160 [Patella vulgata]
MGAGTSSRLLMMKIKDHKVNEIFYPNKPYVHSPEHWRAEPGGLIVELQALPRLFYNNRLETNDGYWYVEASFLPYDDSKLVVSASCYYLLPNLTAGTSTISGIPSGRIFIVDLNKLNHGLGYFKLKGTSTSKKPKLSIHPSGDFIGYIGTGEVNLITLDSIQVYSKQKDISNAAFHCFAIAPNGIFIAIMTRNLGRYELQLSKLTFGEFRKKSVFCHHICPSFINQRGQYTDSVDFKWSPDSKYLAISNNQGVLFILQVLSMRNLCTVFEDVIEGQLASNTGYDFDPQYEHSIMAVATSEVKVHIINFLTGMTLCTLNPCEDESENDMIDCIKFNPDGQSIAVALHSLKIVIISVIEENILLSIDVKSSCPQTTMGHDMREKNILSLAYSSEGQKLLSSCCDGYVRIWNVANQVQTLMALCRLKVLSLQKVSDVKNLKLPKKIKNYLLHTPCLIE